MGNCIDVDLHRLHSVKQKSRSLRPCKCNHLVGLDALLSSVNSQLFGSNAVPPQRVAREGREEFEKQTESQCETLAGARGSDSPGRDVCHQSREDRQAGNHGYLSADPAVEDGTCARLVFLCFITSAAIDGKNSSASAPTKSHDESCRPEDTSGFADSSRRPAQHRLARSAVENVVLVRSTSSCSMPKDASKVMPNVRSAIGKERKTTLL